MIDSEHGLHLLEHGQMSIEKVTLLGQKDDYLRNRTLIRYIHLGGPCVGSHDGCILEFICTHVDMDLQVKSQSKADY